MERLLARLERRFGRYAIHGFTYYLVAVQAVVFVLEMTNPGFTDHLVLDHARVMQGQVWRLVTYLCIPPSSSPIWVIFALYWLYIMGTALEAQWGQFKYQVYLAIGMILTTIFAFVFRVQATNIYLMMSLFLAFATLFPDYQLMIFFILPVKVKWLALLDAAALLMAIGMATGLAKCVPILAVGNYLLFFTPALIDIVRRGSVRARRTGARQAFQRAANAPTRSERVCNVCGVTDADRSVEFRVCTCEKCGTPTNFCIDHARNH